MAQPSKTGASKTTPSKQTRDEESRDAQVRAGADAVDDQAAARADADIDPDVAEHYEEMIDRGAEQPGEGRVP